MFVSEPPSCIENRRCRTDSLTHICPDLFGPPCPHLSLRGYLLAVRGLTVSDWLSLKSGCLYLVDLRRSGLRPHVNHVDSGRDERRQNQTVPPLGGVSEAAAAGVPAGVVQLVTEVRHRQPVNHLTGQSSKVLLLQTMYRVRNRQRRAHRPAPLLQPCPKRIR